MKNNPLFHNCPSEEQLSEYFDRESSLQSEIEQHVKDCLLCRAYLDSLEKLDQSMKNAVNRSCGTDKEIAAKISTRVKTSLKENNIKRTGIFFLSPVVWRAGILLVIGCGIGFLLWKESSQTKENQLSQNNKIQKSAYVSAAFVPSGNVSKKNSQGDDIKNAEIKHHWKASKNIGACLPNILKQCGIPEKSLRKTNAGWILACKLNMKDLNRFKTFCLDTGCQLIYSDSSNINDSDKTFDYEAVFVE